MTPQIPGYLLAFESTVRLFVVAIALALIWMGASRTEGSAQSRYTTAGALSVALIAWAGRGASVVVSTNDARCSAVATRDAS